MTYPNGGLFGPIQRPYLSILEVIEGACTLITPETTITVEAGFIGLAVSATRFEYDYKRNCTTKARWCEGFLPDLPNVDLVAFNNNFPPINTPNALRKLLEVGIQIGNASSPSLNAMRDAIGLAVVRGFLFNSQRSQRDGRLPKPVLIARRILDDGITNDGLDIASVAKQSGVTQQYLISAFKKNLGITPGRYLWRLRLRRAREFLIHTTNTHAEIAFECGFKSQPHFSRSIKKQYGMNPAQLRQDAGYTRPSDEEEDVADVHY